MAKLGHDIEDKLEHGLKVAAALGKVSQRTILEEALAAHPGIKAALQSIEAAPRDVGRRRKA